MKLENEPSLENIEDYNRTITENEKFNYGKKIIPFQRIPISFTDYVNEKVDEKYNSIKSPEKGVFFLESEIINLLNQNDCYSPFENKVMTGRNSSGLLVKHSGFHKDC